MSCICNSKYYLVNATLCEIYQIQYLPFICTYTRHYICIFLYIYIWIYISVNIFINNEYYIRCISVNVRITKPTKHIFPNFNPKIPEITANIIFSQVIHHKMGIRMNTCKGHGLVRNGLITLSGEFTYSTSPVNVVSHSQTPSSSVERERNKA